MKTAVLHMKFFEIARNIRIAESFWVRFRGLMLYREIPWDGILLRPCSSIHTFFMRFSLDAVFMDRAGVILKIREGLRPWRICTGVKGTFQVLELPLKKAAILGLKNGQELSIHESK